MTWSSILLNAAVNSIWQSALLATLVALVLRAFPRTAAAQRYAIWSTVLLTCAALPFANVLLPAHVLTVRAPISSPALLPADTSRIRARAGAARTAVANPIQPRNGQTAADPALLPVLSSASRIAPATAAAVIWAVVAALLLLRLIAGYIRLDYVRRTLSERPLNPAELIACASMTGRTVRVGYSEAVATPCVVGLGEATIVLPAALQSTVAETDMLRILRHECAHIRRRDDYGNLAHQIVRAIFFFNPVVYFASRAIDVDREVACDDAVQLAEAERIEFAKCLYDIARQNLNRAWLPATGFVRYRSHISLRISQLLDRNHNGSTRIGPVSALTIAAIVAAMFPLASTRLAANAQNGAEVRSGVQSRHVRRTAQPPAPMARTATIAQIFPERSSRPTVSPPPVATPKSVAHHAPVRMATATANPRPNPLISSTPVTIAQAERTDDFLSEVERAGFRDLSADDLIAIRNAGISAQTLREFRNHGLFPMGVPDLIRLADSGVTPAYVAEVKAQGLRSVSASDLIRLMNAGVTPEFIARIRKTVLANPSIDDLVRLRNAGV